MDRIRHKTALVRSNPDAARVFDEHDRIFYGSRPAIVWQDQYYHRRFVCFAYLLEPTRPFPPKTSY
jgi:hypothetical protein